MAEHNDGDWYCPKCKVDYKAGTHTCPACGATTRCRFKISGNEPDPAFPWANRHEIFNDDGILTAIQYKQGLSKRQYAAIHLRVPDSGTDWLDKMIRKAQRRESACQIASAIVSNAPLLESGIVNLPESKSVDMFQFVARTACHYAEAISTESDK